MKDVSYENSEKLDNIQLLFFSIHDKSTMSEQRHARINDIQVILNTPQNLLLSYLLKSNLLSWLMMRTWKALNRGVS